MTITYLDTHALDADACRALAGAHPLCVGYPEGVPETWRTPSAWLKGPVAKPESGVRPRGEQWSVTAGGAKRLYWHELVSGGFVALAFPPPDDPAALLGPISEPVEPRPLVEALAAQLDAMEPLVSRLAGILAAQIEEAE